MNATMKIICLFLLFFFGGSYANGQNLENAFKRIAAIKGFQKIDGSAEQYGYPKEIGIMKTVVYNNADPRDKVLDILSIIPSKLVIAEHIDDRGKIERWYMEDLKNGNSIMMYVFVGQGANDLVAQIFTGASRICYHNLAQKIAEDFKE